MLTDATAAAPHSHGAAGDSSSVAVIASETPSEVANPVWPEGMLMWLSRSPRSYVPPVVPFPYLANGRCRATVNFTACSRAACTATDSATIPIARTPAPSLAYGPVMRYAPARVETGSSAYTQRLLIVSAVLRASTSFGYRVGNPLSTSMNGTPLAMWWSFDES